MTIDITDCSVSRFATGISALHDGWGITYYGLHLAIRDAVLLVTTQSKWHPSNLTESLARAQFASVQARLRELAASSAAFAHDLSLDPRRLTLIDDYGMGAVELCHLDGDTIVWATGLPHTSIGPGNA